MQYPTERSTLISLVLFFATLITTLVGCQNVKPQPPTAQQQQQAEQDKKKTDDEVRKLTSGEAKSWLRNDPTTEQPTNARQPQRATAKKQSPKQQDPNSTQ